MWDPGGMHWGIYEQLVIRAKGPCPGVILEWTQEPQGEQTEQTEQIEQIEQTALANIMFVSG